MRSVLPEKTGSDIDIDNLEKAKSEGATASSAGIEALNNSPISFLLRGTERRVNTVVGQRAPGSARSIVAAMP